MPGGPAHNRLTSDGTTATYGYNGDGLRMSKTVSGATTQQTWNIADGIPTLLTDGSTYYIYGPKGLPLEQINGTTVLYYHQDQLGSTRAITDSTGTVQATYTYDPYGELTATTGTLTNPFGYTGQYTDTETGLQYLRARYYDPTTGQFLTRDPLAPVTGTSYAYAGNTPLNLVDPSGLCARALLAGRPAAIFAAAPSGYCDSKATIRRTNKYGFAAVEGKWSTTCSPSTPDLLTAELQMQYRNKGYSLGGWTTIEQTTDYFDDGLKHSRSVVVDADPGDYRFRVRITIEANGVEYPDGWHTAAPRILRVPGSFVGGS